MAKRFAQRTASAAGDAQSALAAGASPEAIRLQLKRTMAAVAHGLTATDESTLWSAFVARELLEPGPAFEIMHNQLWAPGIELVATLIARLQGRGTVDEPARIRAMMMIASLSAFQNGRHVALRAFGWDAFGAAQLAAITAVLDAEIDAL
ncbi:CerR family C-terminal domain-containing protein [Novosphingobium sp. FKTRR1]|uniref:CerR family C-terminal domain-containing protein n=1 Tax=Novosphingobium sp. FKTRR1 TaxID=2879118 RepID=UPI001CF04A31